MSPRQHTTEGEREGEKEGEKEGQTQDGQENREFINLSGFQKRSMEHLPLVYIWFHPNDRSSRVNSEVRAPQLDQRRTEEVHVRIFLEFYR